MAATDIVELEYWPSRAPRLPGLTNIPGAFRRRAREMYDQVEIYS